MIFFGLKDFFSPICSVRCETDFGVEDKLRCYGTITTQTQSFVVVSKGLN